MEKNELLQKNFETLHQKIKEHYNLSLDIKFLVNLKGYRVIGQCKKLSKNSYIVRLHVALLEKFGQIYLDDVLPHELAHAVQMELYPKSKPHSREWKNIVESLSGKSYSPRKKPNYNLDEILKNKKRFTYTCKCMEHQISPTIHKRISENSRVYYCKKCKGSLSFKNLELKENLL